MSVNGLIGRKVGMTSIFDASGAMLGVTVIEVLPNSVFSRKTGERDGYEAAALAWGARKPSRTSKPLAGQAKKAGLGTAPRVVREVEIAAGADPKAGDVVRVGDVFKVGGLVDVTGTSRGHGFQGVHKRHNFNLGPSTHGTKNYREVKSTGSNTFPSRRWAGTKMPGQMGNVRRTVRSLRVVGLDAERNLLLVNGPVPGADDTVVVVRRARAKNRKDV